jgi:hypothetical protein
VDVSCTRLTGSGMDFGVVELAFGCVLVKSAHMK